MTTQSQAKNLSRKIARKHLFLVCLAMLLALSAGVVSGAGHYSYLLGLALIPLGSAVFLFVLNSPTFAFLLCVAALPLQGVVVNVGLNIPPTFLLLWLVLALLLVDKRTTFRRTPIDLAILAFFVVSLLSLFIPLVNPPPVVDISETFGLRGSSFRGLIQLVERSSIFLMMYVTVSVCTSWAMIKRVLNVFVVASVIVVAYGIYQFFAQLFGLPLQDVGTALNTTLSLGSVWSAHFPIPRVRSTFMEPLYFGTYLISVISLFVPLLLYRGRALLNRRLLYLGLIASLIALLLTFSRGAWVSFGVSLVLLVASAYYVGGRQVWPFLKLLASVVAFVVLIVLILIAKTDLDKQILVQRTQSIESSFLGYLSAHVGSPWQFAWDSNRMLGVGLGMYWFYEARLFGQPGSATPMWLYTLLEMGLPGLVAMIWIVVRTFSSSLSALPRLSTQGQALLIGIIAGFAGVLFHSATYNVSWGYTEWFLLGVLFSVIRIELGGCSG